MNRKFRRDPPKVKFETISGTCSLPSRVPSGAKQCSPSWAAAQIRPSASRRNAVEGSGVAGDEDVPSGQGAAFGDVNRRMCFRRESAM